VTYTDSRPEFVRSTLHNILRDRSYIGEVFYQDQWFPGQHEPLVDLTTFSRVQTLLGGKTYNAHSSVYGSNLIQCAYCGHPLVAEIKTKKTKAGPKEYRYYRCSRYNIGDHPKIRLNETALDEQVLELFESMHIEDEKIRAWVVKVLQAKTKGVGEMRVEHLEELQRQQRKTQEKLNRLVEIYLGDEIEKDLYKAKQAELKKRQDEISLECNREYIDSVLEVIVEREGKNNLFYGRSATNHIVHFPPMLAKELKNGDIVMVHIDIAGQHSLTGTIIEEGEK
jgi:site-specific DNA recombinase